MYRNVTILILLSVLAQFSLSSCEALRPISYVPPDRDRGTVYDNDPILFEKVRPREEPATVEAPVFGEPAPVFKEPAPVVEPKGEEALRQSIVDFAQQFVGTRYKIAGKKPDTGFDCSGFTGYIMGQYGIQLSASSKYQEKDGKAIPVSEVQQGDLLFFRREKAGTVFHVAIVISNDQDGLFVIHSTSQRGVVIDNISESSYWRAKYATACRVINP
jgi:hypothetical protein